MTKKHTAAQNLFGEFSPKLAELTDHVLFDDVWARTQLIVKIGVANTGVTIDSVFQADPY